MKMVCGKGINDIPKGWRLESEGNKRIYNVWRNMIYRCYSEKCHEKNPTYEECFVCERWLLLSNFIEDIKLLDNYDLWLNDHFFELDKDIKSNGENKCYCLEECMFIDHGSNTRQANKTRDYSRFQGDNHPLYGKHHSYDAKCKISESMKGKYVGENHPRLGQLIARYDLNMKLIDIKYNFEYKQMGFYSSHITNCCKGKRKTHKGYIFKYYERNGDSAI